MRTHSLADLHAPLDAAAYRLHRAAVKLHELADWIDQRDRVFWHLQPGLSPDAPLLHFAPSHEIEEPFRVSNSAVLRLPGTRTGLVVGRWGITHGDEFEALTQALVPHREPTETELENYTDDHTHGPGPGKGGTFRVRASTSLVSQDDFGGPEPGVGADADARLDGSGLTVTDPDTGRKTTYPTTGGRLDH